MKKSLQFVEIFGITNRKISALKKLAILCRKLDSKADRDSELYNINEALAEHYFNRGNFKESSIYAFVKKYPTYDALLNDDSFMTVTVMKEDVKLALIYDYLDAGQFDNAQHLYNKMLEYAEQEYGKVCQMKAMIYKEKAHLYERTGDLDNAIEMMQKPTEVFKKLPKNDINYYNDTEEFIRRWKEDEELHTNTCTIGCWVWE